MLFTAWAYGLKLLSHLYVDVLFLLCFVCGDEDFADVARISCSLSAMMVGGMSAIWYGDILSQPPFPLYYPH